MIDHRTYKQLKQLENESLKKKIRPEPTSALLCQLSYQASGEFFHFVGS